LIGAAALAAGVSLAQDRSSAGADADLARQFLDVGRQALRDRDPGQAAAALRRAIAHDGDLAEAHYLLGKAYHAARQTYDAVERFDAFLKLAADRDDLPPAAAQWKADAEKRLRTLCVHRRQWDALRAAHARRLAAFAGGRMPSAARALELIAALTSEAADAGKAKAARDALPKPLPPEPRSPDPDGAKMLLEQAAGLRKVGQAEAAYKLTRSAAGICRDAPTLVALAEACLRKGLSAEAAVVADEARQAASRAPAKRREALALAAANVMKKADPAGARAAAALGQFAVDAEALARAAIAGGDLDTAAAIVDLVLELLPGRAPAEAIREKLRDTPLTCTRIPNLAGKWVDFRTTPASGQVKRTARTVEVKARAGKLPGGFAGVAATLSLKPLTWGKFVRVGFRVRHVGPRERGFLHVNLWPAGWGAQLRARYGQREVSLQLDPDQKDYRVVAQADAAALAKLFRPDETYEVCVEKSGAVVAVTVEGRTVLKIELSKDRQRAAAGETVELAFGGVAPAGRDVHLKLTMLEFACSPDCIKPE